MVTHTAERTISIMLTEAQRRLAAELAPELASRLKLDQRNQRAIQLSTTEARTIQTAAQSAFRSAEKGAKRNSLRRLIEKTQDAPTAGAGRTRSKKAGQVYRFKVTLCGVKPPIWRRIEVQDCTFDKLHEQIQTAMGWTNSHLHQFEIGGEVVGDPELLDDGFMDFECVDSTKTRLSRLLPADARQVRFRYEYDFGDGWEHDVVLESVGPPESGKEYPICLAGKRSCPPEDVGGVWGYTDFLEAIANSKHKRHHELIEWCGGSFDPEHFDVEEATRLMKDGLLDWRHF